MVIRPVCSGSPDGLARVQCQVGDRTLELRGIEATPARPHRHILEVDVGTGGSAPTDRSYARQQLVRVQHTRPRHVAPRESQQLPDQPRTLLGGILCAVGQRRHPRRIARVEPGSSRDC